MVVAACERSALGSGDGALHFLSAGVRSRCGMITTSQV